MMLAVAIAGLLLTQSEQELHMVEQKILNQRQSLHRGRLVLKSREVGRHRDKEIVRAYRYEVWFDGKRIRVDRMPEIHSGGTSNREIACHHCERAEHYVYFNEFEFKNKKIAMFLGPMKHAAQDTFKVMIQPKKIGLVPATLSALSQYESTTVIGRADRKKVHLAAEGEGAERLLVVSYELNNNGLIQVKYWVKPNVGNNVVKMTVESDVGKTSLDIEYKQWKDIWFPSSTTYRRDRDGKLDETEQIEILEADFSTPIPDRKFSLAGLDLPKGLWLLENGSKREWNGKSIVTIPPSGVADVAPTGLPRRAWLWVGAGSLALLGFGAFWRYFNGRGRAIAP